MKFKDINDKLKGIPYISELNAKKLYEFIIENNIKSILELGFAHGTATSYMAAALDELGGGRITSVDLTDAKEYFKPSIDDLLAKTSLEKYVKVYRENTGYNWFLHNEIILQSDQNYNCKSKYDLCIIDGPKNWTIDGLAFFLVEKLLNEKGWVIFDDYSWTYAKDAQRGKTNTDGVNHKSLSEEEMNKPQIKDVFHYLVMQHPNFSNFKIHGEGDWAWAQKVKNDVLIVNMEYRYSYKNLISKAYKTYKNLVKKSSAK